MNNFNQRMRGQMFHELHLVEAKLKEAYAVDNAGEIKRLEMFKTNLKKRLYK